MNFLSIQIEFIYCFSAEQADKVFFLFKNVVQWMEKRCLKNQRQRKYGKKDSLRKWKPIHFLLVTETKIQLFKH